MVKIANRDTLNISLNKQCVKRLMQYWCRIACNFLLILKAMISLFMFNLACHGEFQTMVYVDLNILKTSAILKRGIIQPWHLDIVF